MRDRGGPPLIAPRYIHHVTLTTGHVRQSAREEIEDHVIHVCQQLLRSARETPGLAIQIPQMGDAAIRCTDAGIGRCVALVVSAASDDVATIGIATHSRCGAVLWRRLHEGREKDLATRADRCPPEPWCAARLERGIAGFDSDRVGMLGDLERCLAWAYVLL